MEVSPSLVGFREIKTERFKNSYFSELKPVGAVNHICCTDRIDSLLRSS